MKINKSLRTASFIIALVALALTNCIGFIVGATRINDASFITVMVCSNLLIVIEEGLIFLETGKKNGVLYRLLGAPLHIWALISIAVQFVFMLITVIVNRFVDFPIAAVASVEGVVFAFYIVQFVCGFLVRYFSLGLDEKINNKVNAFESFRERMELLAVSVMDENCKKEIASLVDKMRYMDPVSSERTKAIDNEIDAKLSSMEKNCDDASSLLTALSDFKKLLDKRIIISKRK